MFAVVVISVRSIQLSLSGLPDEKEFRKRKTTKKTIAKGPSKSRHIKNVDGYLFPGQRSCTGGRPVKQRLSLNKPTAVGG